MSNAASTHAVNETSATSLVRPHLILRPPDGAPQTIGLLRDPLTIGRHPTNHIVIDIPTVSAEHAVIEYVGGQYRLTDRGSRNGTFVNGQRITAYDLQDGDVIRIGDTRGNSVSLTYYTGQARQSASFETLDLAAYDQLTIGRDATCDLTLPSPLVSRHQARLERSGAAHILIDLDNLQLGFRPLAARLGDTGD